MSPDPPSQNTVGLPMSADEVELLHKSRELLLPAARIAGYDDFAKWLFTTAAVVGTLAVAIPNSASIKLSVLGTKLLFGSMIAIGLSLALAVILRGLEVPKTGLNDISEMERNINRTIKQKGWLVWASGFFFILSLFLADFALLKSSGSQMSPSKAGTLSYSYGKEGLHVSLAILKSSSSVSELKAVAQLPNGELLVGVQQNNEETTGVARLELNTATLPADTRSLRLVFTCDVSKGKPRQLDLPIYNPVAAHSFSPADVSNLSTPCP
ncbi:MAG: hypothetical protein ABI158_13725 [Edaphobacter sp.]